MSTFISAGHNPKGIKVDPGAVANGLHEADLTVEFRNLVVSELVKDSVPCVFEKIGRVSTSEFSLNYKSNQKGIDITDLSIENNVTIITGTKRKWFLGKETQTIDITNSNKLVKQSEIQHVEIQKKKRFYETTLFKVGIGVLAGSLIR